MRDFTTDGTWMIFEDLTSICRELEGLGQPNFIFLRGNLKLRMNNDLIGRQMEVVVLWIRMWGSWVSLLGIFQVFFSCRLLCLEDASSHHSWRWREVWSLVTSSIRLFKPRPPGYPAHSLKGSRSVSTVFQGPESRNKCRSPWSTAWQKRKQVWTWFCFVV